LIKNRKKKLNNLKWRYKITADMTTYPWI